MIQVLKNAAYKHGYLFITAAWLYTFSFVFTNYWSYGSSPVKVQTTLNNHIAQQENRFRQIANSADTLENLISDSASPVSKQLLNNELGIFVFQINDLGNPIQLYWNSSQMFIQTQDVLKPDGFYPVTYQNGLFELMKHTVYHDQKTYVIIGLLPLRWDYFIHNKYLKAEFAGFPNIEHLYRISDQANALPITNTNGKVLFKIERKENISIDHPDSISLLLRVAGLIFIVFFINSVSFEVLKKRGFFKGLFILLSVVIALRFLSYRFASFFNLRKLELFDSFIYASNTVHPSLGDLLINSILVFWVLSFIKFTKPSVWENWQQKLPPQLLKVAGFAALFFFALSVFEVADIIMGLVRDSKISFDVTDFFGLTVYTFISFAILYFLILSLFYLSHILLSISTQADYNLYWRIVIVAASGLFLLSFNIGGATVSVKVVALCWLVLYILLLEYRKKDMNVSILNSSFFLFWIIFFCTSASALVIYQNNLVEFQQRKKMADKLASQIDPSGENLLSLAITNFSNNFFVSNFERLKSPQSNKQIKDSLIRENFSGYLNKYDTRIYTYTNTFQPLFNEDSTSYPKIHSILSNQRRLADMPEIYYYENGSDRFSYLYEKEIVSKDSGLLGYMIVVVKPKRYKSDALYPELFRLSDNGPDISGNYSYAVYTHLHLLINVNDYPFADTITTAQIPRYEFEEKKGPGNYSELWYNTGNNKVIVIARKNSWFIQSLTLFSYLFCFFITLVVLFHLARFILKARFRWRNIKELFVFNIRLQIQTTIVFISIFSFIVIGVATISFFILRFDRNNEEKLGSAIQVMTNEIQENIKNQLTFNDLEAETDLNYTGDLERRIIQISELHNVDINFYDVNGNLKVSTQPYIYNKQILSEKMQPNAFYELHYNHRTQFFQKEHIGNFYYLSVYTPVKESDGTVIAYLNIPYLNSENELNQEISNFLVTLINLNAFIFILAGAIALFLTNRITASFELIGNKMKAINLGEKNEEILWNRNDEIGVLVNEYNKMLNKLEESAQALARSEREGAWQEMARQVAHEIKNPLTPMKLSIQYLQKAVDNNADNVKELAQQVARTLVEQIDQLSTIAGDFSQFANIGNATPQKFDITEVLESLIVLYTSNASVDIHWIKEEGNYQIIQDKVQINRLFTNLIKNAIEASPKQEEKIIFIRQYNEDNQIVIAITDKGPGIPENMRQRIFTPNFTTKSSGTGLGLAICKGIVEKAFGKIWFETKTGEGTTFYVSLPMK